jgi:deoxycytidylate deaminase
VIPCLKQRTRCLIVFAHPGGTWEYEATNECAADGADGLPLPECPRVTAGSKTGEDYHLCGSTHAEANAAALVPDRAHGGGGTAFLYGHNWFCGPCQWALQKAGVSTFVVTGREA